MIACREFLKENERVLVIVGKKLDDSDKIKKILSEYKVDKVYVITKNISREVAEYLRRPKITVIDDLYDSYFEKEESVFEIIKREYGLKEINDNS
jgi:siroheme synthase (precorrin-2 oxidase/ferrochelatase)